jgi:hypothetical protein
MGGGRPPLRSRERRLSLHIWTHPRLQGQRIGDGRAGCDHIFGREDEMTHISGPDGYPRTPPSTGNRPWKADVGCRFAACWSDLYCRQLYSLSSQTVVCLIPSWRTETRLGRQQLRLLVSPNGPQSPGRLVGQRHRRAIHAAPSNQLLQPQAQRIGLTRLHADHRARPVNQ